MCCFYRYLYKTVVHYRKTVSSPPRSPLRPVRSILMDAKPGEQQLKTAQLTGISAVPARRFVALQPRLFRVLILHFGPRVSGQGAPATTTLSTHHGSRTTTPNNQMNTYGVRPEGPQIYKQVWRVSSRTQVQNSIKRRNFKNAPV